MSDPKLEKSVRESSQNVGENEKPNGEIDDTVSIPVNLDDLDIIENTPGHF